MNEVFWSMPPCPHQIWQNIASILQVKGLLHNPIIAHFPVIIVPCVVLAGRITQQTAAPQVYGQANASYSWSSGADGSPKKPLTGTFIYNAAED
jgi:hypothetical protein